MKEKYYFFGAGNNGLAALKFWGVDSAIAIVDNNPAGVGLDVMGVKVISFEDFRKRWRGEQVIITAVAPAEAISRQLEAAGITNYFLCPYIQSGFYTCEEMIERWKLTQYDTISIYDRNPIAERLVFELSERNFCEVNYIEETELYDGKNQQNSLLLVFKQNIDIDGLEENNRFKKILNFYQEIEILRNEDFQYLNKYKNLHLGEKCFLIGNGPSLSEVDLDKIYRAGIKSFGCNAIWRLFPKTIWRPDYYVIGDGFVWEREKDNLPKECKYILRKSSTQIKNSENVDCYYSKPDVHALTYPCFSEDLTAGICLGTSVMYDMLQIAVYMGFSKIYLLGVDCSFGEDGRNSHFCKEYIEDDDLEHMLTAKFLGTKETLIHAYSEAKKYADSHGIKIYNATRGGYLEVFERIDFDSLL